MGLWLELLKLRAVHVFVTLDIRNRHAQLVEIFYTQLYPSSTFVFMHASCTERYELVGRFLVAAPLRSAGLRGLPHQRGSWSGLLGAAFLPDVRLCE